MSRNGGLLRSTRSAWASRFREAGCDWAQPRVHVRELWRGLGRRQRLCGRHYAWRQRANAADEPVVGQADPPPPVKGRRAPAGASNEPRLLVGFDGSIGYSPRQGETAMAIGAGIPTALALQSGTVRITPFITPGIGYGRLSHVAVLRGRGGDVAWNVRAHGRWRSRTRFGTSGIGANVGFQRVLKGRAAPRSSAWACRGRPDVSSLSAACRRRAGSVLVAIALAGCGTDRSVPASAPGANRRPTSRHRSARSWRRARWWGVACD